MDKHNTETYGCMKKSRLFYVWLLADANSFPVFLNAWSGLFLARSIHELFLYGEHFGKVVQKYVQ
jgi:hypothetical protein